MKHLTLLSLTFGLYWNMWQACDYAIPCFHQLSPSPFMFVAEQVYYYSHIPPPAIEARDVTCKAVHLVTADLNVPCACLTHLLSTSTALIRVFTHYISPVQIRFTTTRLLSLPTVCIVHLHNWPFKLQWSLYVRHSGHYMYRTLDTTCTTSLTFNNPTFCPNRVFMCSVWISEKTAIISLYNINWLVFITERECVYCEVRTECLYVT
jgi:predicted GNAT family N-acyltransferase